MVNLLHQDSKYWNFIGFVNEKELLTSRRFERFTEKLMKTVENIVEATYNDIISKFRIDFTVNVPCPKPSYMIGYVVARGLNMEYFDETEIRDLLEGKIIEGYAIEDATKKLRNCIDGIAYNLSSAIDMNHILPLGGYGKFSIDAETSVQFFSAEMFDELYQKESLRVAMDFLKSKCEETMIPGSSFEQSILCSNYMRILDRLSLGDCLRVLRMMVKAITADAVAYCIKNSNITEPQEQKNEMTESLKSQMDELLDRVKDIANKKSSYEEDIEIIKKKLEAEKEKNKKLQGLINKYELEKEREQNKNKKTEEEKEIKETQRDTEPDTKMIETDEQLELDTDVKFAFFMEGDKTNCWNRLMKHFPNSTYSDKVDYNLVNVQLAVFLTANNSHALSVAQKEICTKRGIPVQLIGFKNIERIKQEILKAHPEFGVPKRKEADQKNNTEK